MKLNYLQLLILYFSLLTSNCFAQTNWVASNTGLSVNSYVNDFAQTDNGDIYIVVNSGGQGQLLKSINNGSSWSSITTNGLPTGGWANNLFIKNATMFLGTGGLGSCLYSSTDKGLNWIASNSGLPSISYVNDFVETSNGDIFVIINSNLQGYLYKSSNNGSSWSNQTVTGLPAGAWAGSFFIKDGIMFLGTGSLGSYLYSSTDNGKNWTASNSGLPSNSYVNDFAVTSNGDIYTIINSNLQGYLYKSINNGSTWSNQTVTGLPAGAWAGSFFIKNNIMYVGTGNLVSQLYRSTISTGISNLENNLSITVSPNPTKGLINIKSQIKIDFIRITSVVGQTIYELRPSNNDISFHIDRIGIYYVSVTSGKQTMTKKLLVTK